MSPPPGLLKAMRSRDDQDAGRIPAVAVLNPLSRLGGSEISLLELLRRTGDRFRFHLILPEDGPLREEAEAAGIRVRVLPWPGELLRLGERDKKLSPFALFRAGLSVVPFVGRLARLLHEIGADLLLTNGIKCHILGALVRRKHSGPLVWYLREGLEGRRFTSLALRILSHRCSAAVAISRFVAGEWRGLFQKPVPLNVLYNIIDLEAFRPGLPHPPDLPKGEGEIRFGIVGAVTPLKGLDVFLRAAARIAHSVPKARFLIVGANLYETERGLGYEARLRDLTQELGLRDRVTFTGFRSDIPAVLSTLDVLVHANRGPEGLGRSILEAMACGVPVIAVDRWGPAEIIRHGLTGLLFPPRDTWALADRMTELAIHDDLRGRLSENAGRWVRANIHPEALADDFSELLVNLLDNRPQTAKSRS